MTVVIDSLLFFFLFFLLSVGVIFFLLHSSLYVHLNPFHKPLVNTLHCPHTITAMDITHTHQDDIQMATNGAEGHHPVQQPHTQTYPQQHAPPEPQDDIHMAMDAQHEVIIKQEEPSGHMDVDMEAAAEAALSSHANHADSPMGQASSITASVHAALPVIKQETAEETCIKQDTMEEASTKQETVEDRLDAALEGNDDKTGGYESSDLESSDDDDDGP